jgi:hypothetical protein
MTQCCATLSHANFFWFCLLLHGREMTGRAPLSFWIGWVSSKAWHGKVIMLALLHRWLKATVLTSSLTRRSRIAQLSISWCWVKHTYMAGWADWWDAYNQKEPGLGHFLLLILPGVLGAKEVSILACFWQVWKLSWSPGHLSLTTATSVTGVYPGTPADQFKP